MFTRSKHVTGPCLKKQSITAGGRGGYSNRHERNSIRTPPQLGNLSYQSSIVNKNRRFLAQSCALDRRPLCFAIISITTWRKSLSDENISQKLWSTSFARSKDSFKSSVTFFFFERCRFWGCWDQEAKATAKPYNCLLGPPINLRPGIKITVSV